MSYKKFAFNLLVASTPGKILYLNWSNKKSELKVKEFLLKSWYQLSWPEFTTHRGPEQLCASLLCHLVASVIGWVLSSWILRRCWIFDLREMKSLQNLLSAREVKEAQSGAMTTNSSHESEKHWIIVTSNSSKTCARSIEPWLMKLPAKLSCKM